MTTYFIKVIICSALFFIVYTLLFENEKMHRFNRFYLLFSIVFSCIVPFVTIETNQQILPLAETGISNIEISDTLNNAQTYAHTNSNDKLPFILLSIYVTIAMLLLLRFGVNLKILYSRISNSPFISYNNANLVLINDNVTPHSFLKYIFINKEDYNNGKIEKEILLHELTHVQQKHSMDVLFIELVQTVFWFNPVFIFYRKAIELNHEFLADDRVVNTTDNYLHYQHLLIDKASQKKSLFFTSQFNYLITKKRLIMMTKSTSPRRALYKQIALVPLTVAVIFTFSTKTIAQDTTKIVKPEQKEIQSTKEGVSQEMLDEYERIIIKNKLNAEYVHATPPPAISVADKKRLETIFLAMSKAQQAKQIVTFEPPTTPMPRNMPTEEEYKLIKNPKKYAIIIDDKKVSNMELDKYKPSDFWGFSIIYLAKTNSNYGKHLPLDVHLMTKENYKAYVKFVLENPPVIMKVGPFKKFTKK